MVMNSFVIGFTLARRDLSEQLIIEKTLIHPANLRRLMAAIWLQCAGEITTIFSERLLKRLYFQVAIPKLGEVVTSLP